MRLHFTTRTRRAEKAPSFFEANLVLATASLAFGLVAIGGWFLAYLDVSLWLAAFLSVISLVSALVVPVTAGAFNLASGWAKFFLGVTIATFMMIDWAGVHQGYMTIEKMATKDAHEAALATWESDRAAAQLRVVNAQDKLDALPTSLTACEGFGPQNCAVRLSGIEADRTTFTAERETASAEIKAIGPAPVRPELFPHWLVGLVTGAVQIVLFIGFGALAETTRKERQRLRDERKATETRRRRKRGKPQLTVAA